MSFQLPDAAALASLSAAQQTAVLDNLFEPCPTLTSLLVEKLFATDQKYVSYKQLIEEARRRLLEYLEAAEASEGAIRPEISLIIAAHPRLGAPKKNEHLSEHSSAEQRSLQGTQAEQTKLKQLNEDYEAAFPGLRYVVFVNGRPRPEIMANMQARIDRGDIRQERVEAFNAMCDIALDRARKLGAKL